MAEPAYTLGLDYGTSSVRCLVVRAADGAELGEGVYAYPHGVNGVIGSATDPDLARQHPADYLNGAEAAVAVALRNAATTDSEFSAQRVRGIGVDTTGSTPLPVDASGTALAMLPEFMDNPNAMGWLWKDHTSADEAAEITRKAASQHPEYLARCGGTYSSEWYWSKILHCARTAPKVAAAAADWVELADWLPAMLCGTQANPVRGICTAGHKAMYHTEWGGYPDARFLAELCPALSAVRAKLGNASVLAVDSPAGRLTKEWAQRLALPQGIPVAVGALDAHLGAVGSGIAPGTLVKVLGTSSCDMMVAPLDPALPDIPGLCGIVPGSILPDFYGLEAGQAAVGDLFAWWVEGIRPADRAHDRLAADASSLRPGESGLLALDWNNGNRTVLVDPRLTGLILGQTLSTTGAEVYRALIEASAFGARIIIDRFEEYGVNVERVVACGGIAEKSPLVMQIYADILNRPMRLSRSAQTCALGAAAAGAVVSGLWPDLPAAQRAMTGLKADAYIPNLDAVTQYNKLFELYQTLHDAFGTDGKPAPLNHIMKKLITIRDSVRRC